MKKLLGLVGIVLAFMTTFSCTPTKAVTYTELTSPMRADTVTLCATAIGPMFLPVFPLIDASLFNAKAEEVAPQIMSEEADLVNEYQTMLLADLNATLQATVYTPDQLLDSNRLKESSVSGSLPTSNDIFPFLFYADNSLELIDVGKGRNVRSKFTNPKDIQERVASISEQTKSPLVLVSYNRLAVISIGMMGTTGTLRLESNLFLYSRRGRLLAHVLGTTEPTNVGGRTLARYKEQLDQFPELSRLMAKEMKRVLQ